MKNFCCKSGLVKECFCYFFSQFSAIFNFDCFFCCFSSKFSCVCLIGDEKFGEFDEIFEVGIGIFCENR